MDHMTNTEITTKKNEIKERIAVLTDLKTIYESEIQTDETIREISNIDSNIKELNQKLTNFRRIELERYNKARRDELERYNKTRRDEEGENEKEQRARAYLLDQRRLCELRDKERRDKERREREYQDSERERRCQERREQERLEIARRELERREQEVRERERRNRAPIGFLMPMGGNFMAPVGIGFAQMVGGFARSSSIGHHNSHLMEAMRPHTSTTVGLQRLIGPPINFRNY